MCMLDLRITFRIFRNMDIKALILSALIVISLCSAEKCNKKCPDLNATSLFISDFVKPNYVLYLPKRPEFEKIDNVCYSVYSLPDKVESAILYQSQVNNDGSNEVISLICQQKAPGVLKVTAPSGTSTRAIIAADCDIIIFDTCTEFGGPESYTYGVSAKAEAISEECLQSSLKVHASRGLLADEDKYFKLPYKLPTKCV